MVLRGKCCRIIILRNPSLLYSSTTLPTRSHRKRRPVSFLQMWRYVRPMRRVPRSRWWSIRGLYRSNLALACRSIILGTPGRGSLTILPRNVLERYCASDVFSGKYRRLCELNRDANVGGDGIPRHCLWCGGSINGEDDGGMEELSSVREDCMGHSLEDHGLQSREGAMLLFLVHRVSRGSHEEVAGGDLDRELSHEL